MLNLCYLAMRGISPPFSRRNDNYFFFISKEPPRRMRLSAMFAGNITCSTCVSELCVGFLTGLSRIRSSYV